MNILTRIWSRVSTSSKYLITPRRPFWSRGHIVVNEDSAMGIAAYNRGLIYISSQVAKLPWQVKDSNNQIIPGSLSNLLNVAPNREMNAMVWRMYMVQQAVNWGNSFAEIERNVMGAPVALWPLESGRMCVMRDYGTGDLYYRYSDPNNGEIYFDPKDIFHVRNFHMKDMYQGQGLIGFARETLGIQIAADQMAGSLFHNSGIPSGLLEHPGKLSDEAYKRLKETWDGDNGGKKSGSTRVLEEGMKYNTIKIDPETLQFLQSRQFGVLEIARFLGVPPTKLFDVTAATFSNVENANLEVATDTLDSWASMLMMEADVKLLNSRHSGRYTSIDLYEIFRGDMKTRADYFKTMMSIAAINPNEIRELEGMSPYEQGSNFYIATNNFTPVNRMDEVINANIAQKTQPATPNTPNPDQTATQNKLAMAVTKYLETE